jgi:fructose-1,6-bisphosphatase/inositol monophosphatase family enzyme
MDLTLEGRLSLARHIARLATHHLRAGMHRVTSTAKADGSPVTAVDLAVNALTIKELTTHDPGCQVLGEEESTDALDLSKPIWVVDPIDGTFSFTAGIGLSTFALSYVVDGLPVVSVVADPWTRAVYEATTMRPTTRNGRPVSVQDHPSLSRAAVALETSSGFITSLRPHVTRVVALGASCIAGAAVASGGLSALCFGPGHPWDVATSYLLVTQAGGAVVARDGNDLDFTRPQPALVLAASDELAHTIAGLWRTDVAAARTPVASAPASRTQHH